MKKIVSGILAASMLMTSLTGITSAETAPAVQDERLPAFPGAEGGGMYTSGGRGGDVYEVTTLADSGPGSLREAVSRDNTTVVFKVAGTIHLETPLKITGSNLTIAGQTAPGEGVTVSDYATTIEADNVIVRYMRFRLGDRYPSEDDAFGSRYHKDIIIDHSSFSWSVDEVLSMYVNENTTVQWSIISESMLMTSHQKGRHGYAGIWGGNNATFHHNLIAHNVSRNPRFAGSPNFPTDSSNNIIYNWGFFSAYGGEEGNYNLRNNYYKYGPNTYRSVRDQIFLDVSANTRLYVDGNIMDGSPEVTANNWLGVGELANPDSKLNTAVSMPNPINLDTAETAYERVLQEAGAVLPRRDAIDARVVHDVKNRSGKHINSPKEVGGYLEFEEAVSTLADDDHDGMPNEWELAHGLNPSNAEDRNGIHSSGYTNLEMYLNGIVGNGSINPAVSISYPADNTIVEEGATVEIQADASDSDGTVSKVEFYQDDIKLGEDLTAPYSLNWENVQDGTYFLTVRAIDDSGTSTQSSNAAVHVNKPGDISPWQSEDIGAPEIAGHTQLGQADTDVTLKSAGDIDGEEDHFHFAYQELTGNGEIVARVESITGTDDGAEAGVMIRENLESNAKMAALLVSYVKYGKKSIVMSRNTEGEPLTREEPEHFINTPYWVKIVRLGDQFTSLISENGTDWKVVDSATISMGETVYFGLAVDASKADDDNSKYNTSVFSNASVNPVAADFPTAPTGLTATAGLTSIELNWDEVTTAQGYTVYRSEIPGGPYSEVATGIVDNAYNDGDLTPGLTYYYIVTAENSSGTSFNSKEASATPEGEQGTVYYINENFEDAAIDTTPAEYTFMPNPQDTDHKVVVKDIPSDTTGNASDHALLLYDNAVGSTEFFRKFAPQKGKFILEVDMTSPGWPGTSTVLNLQDETGSKTALSIQLRKPTAPVAEPDYTLVYKRNGADYKLTDPLVNNQWYNLRLVTNVAAKTADIYLDNQLVADDAPLEADLTASGIGRISTKTPGTGKGTIYYDNLKVYVEPVESPKGLTAVPGNEKAQLQWTAAEGASTYSIKRSMTEGGPYETVTSGITDVSYIDEDLVNNTTYYYVVTAVGSTGESGPSNEVTVTPSSAAIRPDAPAGITISARSTQADLNWQGVDHAISYTIKRSTDPEGPFETVASKVSSTSYRDGGLDNGTTYYYVISAVSIGGEGENSEAVTVIPTAQLSTPTVTAAPLPNGAELHWESLDGASSYEVRRSDTAEGAYNLIRTVSESTYLDSGLMNGVPYYYRVTAVNDQTRSLESAAVGIRPSANDGTPAAPSGFTTEPAADSVILNWNSVSEATYYSIKRSSSENGPYELVVSDLTKTSYTDSGLTNGIPYYYIITATNAVGEGASSVTLKEVPAQVIVVAKDGTGQYSNVQDAINSVPSNSPTQMVIKIKDGIYREKISVPSDKINLRFIGESREGTILIYGDSASTLDGNGNPLGTSNSYSFRVLANDFTAERLTIQNDAGIDAGQAVALYANNGRHYYKDSYIEGTVDFIFGNASAVFENSDIHSLRNGYVTAASTGAGKPGYVFINSRITADPGITGVTLGRPWRADANVIYVNSYLGEHISPEGWNNWGNVNNETTARYGEYASYGPGANPKSRYRWTKQLTLEEAAWYTPANILSGSDGWNPVDSIDLANSNRELEALNVDGVAIPDFDPQVTAYQVELEAQSEIPIVTATAQSEKSVISIEQAENVPGSAVIHVTSQDGGVKIYEIEFVIGEDEVPPVLQLEVDKPVLKARGHRMENIRVTANAADEESGIASITLVSITSNEPDNGKGDGNTNDDIQGAEYGTSDYEFELRAERSGAGSGRVYTITYEAADYAGNRTTATVTVTVEH
ncbi:pectinesterase family protein [Paenibacillus shunpengii]|uniref:Pectinesterase family protein n=1 Tax=Paenibacillus shunpengii TaxID=2054424 RepID=A0ABW5SN43_9BACL